MGNHDDYGKQLMSRLLGSRWSSCDSRRSIDEGGVRADLDGIISARDNSNVECAVEIEARVYKQIRGAMVDLALHPAPKKLLVVIKAQPQLGDATRIEKHCRHIWQEIAGSNRGQFFMTVLKGTGNDPRQQVDLELLSETLRNMKIL